MGFERIREAYRFCKMADVRRPISNWNMKLARMFYLQTFLENDFSTLVKNNAEINMHLRFGISQPVIRQNYRRYIHGRHFDGRR